MGQPNSLFGYMGIYSLEGLTATFMSPGHEPRFTEERMWKGPRGAPQNIGASLARRILASEQIP